MKAIVLSFLIVLFCGTNLFARDCEKAVTQELESLLKKNKKSDGLSYSVESNAFSFVNAAAVVADLTISPIGLMALNLAGTDYAYFGYEVTVSNGDSFTISAIAIGDLDKKEVSFKVVASRLIGTTLMPKYFNTTGSTGDVSFIEQNITGAEIMTNCFPDETYYPIR